MVSAGVAFAVNFLAAARDVDFKWYDTWDVFWGAAFVAEFLAVAGATTVVLDFWSLYSSCGEDTVRHG